MAVLVFAKHDNAALNDATAKTVTAAKGLGGEIHVLVAGDGLPRAVGRGRGARRAWRKVIHRRGRRPTRHRLAEPLTDARASRWPAPTSTSSSPATTDRQEHRAARSPRCST